MEYGGDNNDTLLLRKITHRSWCRAWRSNSDVVACRVAEILG